MMTNNMRPAFSMITAIFMIVIMASIGAFVMNLSGKMVQETTEQYRHEQAILYARSYTEFAIMAATANKCAKKITANVDGDKNGVERGLGYRVTVNIQYIGENSGCKNNIGDKINHAKSKGSIVLIDTYVQYRDPQSYDGLHGDGHWRYKKSSSNTIYYPGMTYHKRTLQRL